MDCVVVVILLAFVCVYIGNCEKDQFFKYLTHTEVRKISSYIVRTVAAKIAIVLKAQAAQVPVMSSMGAGNKVNPASFEVADIYKTSVCPLARVMRQAMKKHGVKHLKVVYSKELPLVPDASLESKGTLGRPVPGSTAFAPSAAGLIIASEVVKDLIGFAKK